MELARREVLRWAARLAALLSVALVGVPSLRAFAWPVFRRARPQRWIKLAEVEQIEPGIPLRFDFVESASDAWIETRELRGVWIYTDDGETFTVYNGRCTHLACSYGFDVERRLFHCPCHHGMFDLRTGAVTDGPPPRPLDTLETRIEGGFLYAAYQEFRAGIGVKRPVA